MKILVPFKSVPDPNDAIVPGAAASTAKSVINPFDEIAIEEALRIRERGDATEIVGVTIGAPAVDEQIRAALAMGVDRAIRVDDSPSTRFVRGRAYSPCAGREGNATRCHNGEASGGRRFEPGRADAGRLVALATGDVRLEDRVPGQEDARPLHA